jgi:hypothetical protein
MGGEEQAIKDVKALSVGYAIGPRLDVTRPQELRLIDARDWAPPSTII